jgi:hypothetical protein
VRRLPGARPAVAAEAARVLDVSLNLITHTAAVTFDPAAASPDALVAAIRPTGFGAELAAPDRSAFEEQAARPCAGRGIRGAAAPRRRASVSGAVGAPAIVLSMPLMTRGMAAGGRSAVEGAPGAAEPVMRRSMTGLTPALRGALTLRHPRPGAGLRAC